MGQNGDNGSGRWTVRIGILGPLEVRDEAGQLVRLGGPRLRALLIRLALDPGRGRGGPAGRGPVAGGQP